MGADTPADFAEKVGVTTRALSNYLAGRMPKAEVRKSICAVYGINPMWLFQGVGPIYTDEKMADTSVIDLVGKAACIAGIPDPDAADVSAIAPDGVQTIYVPKVEARLSAGTGSLEVSGNIKGYFGFRSDWLRRKGCPSRMVLMSVTGDSMRPTLENGDLALVNTAQTDVVSGGIYAVGVDDSVLIKRLDKRPGKIVLVSDNRDAYAPQELDMTDEVVRDSLRVIGRVLWWCREA
ncbi:LexA family transcriptional regulator [Desulfovibrio sp.]|uniref:LexA family transcriptional regulator n=1 Tax=Desulfovibrio sp. TaxID=885 RepID=UPI003D0ACC92